jgi:hypothetical protein
VIQLVGGVYSTRLPLMKVGIVSSMLYNRVQVPAPVFFWIHSLLFFISYCVSGNFNSGEEGRCSGLVLR